MKVIKPLRLSFLHRCFEFSNENFFVATVLVLFPFDSPKHVQPEADLWKMIGAELGRFGVFDHGMAKPQGELLVSGFCYPPDGKEEPASYVRLVMGGIDKKLYVIGDRTWGLLGPSDPKPFRSMPIDYAHAFGGEKYPQNPAGKGFAPVKGESGTSHPLPNVEDPNAMIQSKGDRPAPMTFAPWDLTWPQHFAKMGTYDQQWQKEQFPGFALNIDWGVFNVAPPDQRLQSYFIGDESFRIENMHPEKRNQQGQLPDIVARCFLRFAGPETHELSEVPMRLETVHLFPHLERGVLIFRGACKIAEADASDILYAMAALEDRGSSYRELAHYQTVLSQRLDKEKAHIYMLRDKDLMPASFKDAPKSAPLAPDELDKIVATEGLLQKNARNRTENELQSVKARMAAAGLDPGQFDQLNLPPEEKEPEMDELPDYVEKLTLLMEQQKADALKKQKEHQDALRSLCRDNALDYDELVLAEKKKSAGPPKYTAAGEIEKLKDQAQLARNAGVRLPGIEEKLSDPAFYEQLKRAEEAMREGYWVSAHLRDVAAEPMDAEASAQARKEILKAYVQSKSLARRDFTGVDLSGLDLRGIDFEGAFLESANLENADLSGANLKKAVLAHARLNGTKLSFARMSQINLGRADLRTAELKNADLTDSILYETDLRGAVLKGAKLSGAQLLEVVLEGADLSQVSAERLFFLRTNLFGTKWEGARLVHCAFVEADISGTDFSGADLKSSAFVTVKGEGAIFRGAKLSNLRVVHGSSFEGAIFSGAQLMGSNFRKTLLKGANFEGADLSKSEMSETDMRDVNFHKAVAVESRFNKTNLSGANMISSNLMMCLFHGARLGGADFRGANLFAADLTRAVGDEATSFDEANVKRVVHTRSQ